MKKYNRIKLEEMSNLFPEDTGVPFTIWISTKSGREKHNARIKISNSDGEAVISIWGEPKIISTKGKIRISGKDFKMLIKFITLNRDILLKHWNGETSSKQFTIEIKSI